MIQFIFQKLIDFYPAVGFYTLIFVIIIYATYKISVYSIKVRDVVNDFPSVRVDLEEMKVEIKKIPRMEQLLEKIDRNLSSLTLILVEKNIISRSYHENV